MMPVLQPLFLLCGLNEGSQTAGIEVSAASPRSFIITEESIHVL